MYCVRNHLEEPYHTLEFEIPAGCTAARIHDRIENVLEKRKNIAWHTTMNHNGKTSLITVIDAKTAIRDIEHILKEENVYLKFEGVFYHAQSNDTEISRIRQEIIDNPAIMEEMDMIKTICNNCGIYPEESWKTNCLCIRCQDFTTLDFIIQTAAIHNVSIHWDFV